MKVKSLMLRYKGYNYIIKKLVIYLHYTDEMFEQKTDIVISSSHAQHN